MAKTPFGAKLELVLKVFSMSRAQLAADLAVDKSVIGRWVSGAVAPATHNMAHLTRYIAGRRPGFTMLDWDRAMPDFADLFGVQPPGPDGAGHGIVLPIMGQIKSATETCATDLECFFQTTRPAEAAPGRFLHDQGMLRLGDDGLLEVRMGIRETVYAGWLFPIRGKLFCIATDAVSGALVFAIFSTPPPGRVQRLDGVSLGIGAGSLPGITAATIMLDRIGDLSGDAEADERRYQERLMQNPLAPEGSIPEDVLAHLSRDFGPAQLAMGGDLLLQIPFHRSLARSLTPVANPKPADENQVVRPQFGRAKP
ncbi:hypothetical protein [Phenylobacterium sp.]|uniref:hypothetical protein n=1 Tax=Phenylobacterium sp. TaxID=1871053 RepID=UPI00273677CF|nr:hypothetical protein [Phenylobacterium sp.]MDP3853384.1 hypothetical protein [Phenylobacterium sp.]